jgi:hypothetical protein
MAASFNAWNRKAPRFLLCLVLLASVIQAHSAELPVAKNGQDANSGAADAPFLTINRAATDGCARFLKGSSITTSAARAFPRRGPKRRPRKSARKALLATPATPVPARCCSRCNRPPPTRFRADDLKPPGPSRGNF